ncbi:EamA family transporter [Allokutzneria multivorans]|uniref:EamA family transporter n=1 Tax=Allokutzneria multivorans TaxID=1142134 RepID=A0ABP7ST90_9PSEU
MVVTLAPLRSLLALSYFILVLNNRIGLIAVTALAPAIWGTTYLVTTEFLPPDRPLLAATVRALPAGLLLLAITRRLPSGSWWWRAAVLGTLNIGAFLALLFVAAYRLPGGIAATVGALQPLLVAGFSAGLLGQRMSARTVVAALAAILGVGLLVLKAEAQLDAIGLAAAVGSAVVMAAGVVLSKRWTSPAPVLATTGWQLIAGGIVLIPVTLLVEGPPPAELSTSNLLGYAYLSIIGAAFAYALWFRGIRELPPTQVTFLGQLSPVVATMLGWLALGQELTVLQAIGALIVLAALIVAQTRKAAPLEDHSVRSSGQRRQPGDGGGALAGALGHRSHA